MFFKAPRSGKVDVCMSYSLPILNYHSLLCIARLHVAGAASLKSRHTLLFFHHASCPCSFFRAVGGEDDAGTLVDKTRKQDGAATWAMRGMRAHKCEYLQILYFNEADCIVEGYCSFGLANEHRLHIEVYAGHLPRVVQTTSMCINTSSVEVDACTHFVLQGWRRGFCQNMDNERAHLIDMCQLWI